MPIKPLPSEKFRPQNVRKIIEVYLEKNLKGVTQYVADDAQNLCKKISGELRTKIKDLKYDRYK
jgi:hypothetical protein